MQFISMDLIGEFHPPIFNKDIGMPLLSFAYTLVMYSLYL